VIALIQQIAIGSVLMIVTSVIHAGCTIAALWALRRSDADRRVSNSRRAAVMLISALVLMMFYASLFEALIWALTYLAVGAISGLEEALYFSTVTYTTLGYGDVVLDQSWRLLASFQAANGIIMFGWTTALIVSFITHVVIQRRQAASPDS
jgi:voltage-gated potassium channel Kch